MEQESEKAIFEEITKLPTESLKKKLLMLNSLNKEKIKLEEDGYEKEYNVLKEKFDIQYRDIYQQISKIVTGETKPEVTEEEAKKYAIVKDADQEKGIPDYWSEALKHSAYFPSNDKDDVVLKHLVDVRMKSEEKLNFSLEFEFSANEFFTPNILTKTYYYNDTEEIEKTTGCQIQWSSQEKNPRVEVKTKKVKKGKSVETKKTESLVPSFFDLFADTTKEDAMATDEATFWREDFFANSLEYYLNIIDSEAFGAGEDEDDEDDDEDEEEIKDKKKIKGDKKVAPADAKNEKCKNQ